jgi:long-chain-fatty-acid--CoA ligase ACSBG
VKQLDKFPKIKEFLPNVKASVQYTGTPTQEGIQSWQELLELGKKESDDEPNDRMNQIAIISVVSWFTLQGPLVLQKE